MRTILISVVSLFLLSACVTDSSTRQALQQTLDAVQRIADTLQAELDSARLQLNGPPDLVPTTSLNPALLRTDGGLSRATQLVTATVNGVGTRVNESVIQVTDYGYWAKIGEDTLFDVDLTATTTITNGVARQTYSPSISGAKSGTNPNHGRAIWSGGVRAVTIDSEQVEGGLEVGYYFDYSIGNGRVDVFMQNFSYIQGQEREDISWEGLLLINGEFESDTTLFGSLYGEEHQGVAGRFERNGLRGVFGGLRE